MTDAPYPNSYDKTRIVVFCTKTGTIRQVVDCTLEVAHLQHQAFPDHDYIDATGSTVSPHDHAVDLASRKVIARTAASAGDVALKSLELTIAFRAEAPEADHTTILHAALGNASARATVQATANQRDASQSKLNGLLASVKQAKTRDELAAIKW